MDTKTEDPIIKDITDIMSGLLGKMIAESMMDSIKKFDNPLCDRKVFFESSIEVFSEILGEELVTKKLQPIKEKYEIT